MQANASKGTQMQTQANVSKCKQMQNVSKGKQM
jgi:hypothetical protein